MRAIRLAFVVLMATSILAVVPDEGKAVVPGDIGRIIFVSNRESVDGDIYVRDFAGSFATRITNVAGEEMEPKWSPDGTSIAFSRNVGSEMVPLIDLHVMNPDGSGETNLTNSHSYYDVMADWSPDGMWILFASDRGGNQDLWRMRPDGSDPQRLTNSADEEWGAVWSPDGATIAFCSGLGISTLWLMDADGSNQRALPATVDGCDPSWSPDGSRIAYQSFASMSMDIWVVNADGTNPVNITNDPMEYYHRPAWSPDGSRIAFERLDMDWELLMINPDGTGLETLANSPTTLEWDVDWESVSRVPVAEPDEAYTHRAQAVEIDVLANDFDIDGEDLTVTDITRIPSEGVVTINPTGTITYEHNGTAPLPGVSYPYRDSFDYSIEDERHAVGTGTVDVIIYPGFDDVEESSPFFDHILWLAREGITKGCNPPANTLFCPTQRVTRGQMAAFLVRMLGYEAGAGGNLFVDDDGIVFEADIDRLGTVGVTRGCNPPVNDHFCPDEYVTRGQMAAFLARAFGLASLGGDDLFVDDNGLIFEPNIDRLGEHGISKGCNPPANDMFCPNDYVTREQMAAFLHRATP